MASRMVFTIILLIFVSSIMLSTSSGVLQPAQVTTTVDYTHLLVLTTTQSFLSTRPTAVFEGNKSPATTDHNLLHDYGNFRFDGDFAGHLNSECYYYRIFNGDEYGDGDEQFYHYDYEYHYVCQHDHQFSISPRVG